MIPTARVFPIPHFRFKGGLVDPRLRASNEHILIVRVPRAGGRPGYPSHPSQAARCASKGIVPVAPPPVSVACLEEGHTGVSDGGVVLIGDPAVVA
jgi:hypothetical protein